MSTCRFSKFLAVLVLNVQILLKQNFKTEFNVRKAYFLWLNKKSMIDIKK